MKKILFLLAFCLFSSTSYSEYFKIGKSYPDYIELYMLLDETHGKSIAQILNNISFSNKELTIRILGRLSEKSNKEMIDYYKRAMPQKYQDALKSNSYSPQELFYNGFQQTTLFKNLIAVAQREGYQLVKMDSEKFRVDKKSISAPDIHIFLKKLD